jgi:hypothetical protein
MAKEPSRLKSAAKAAASARELPKEQKSSASPRLRKAPPKRRALSSKKVVGARVYAKFTNDSYYWGWITKKNAKNFSVS